MYAENTVNHILSGKAVSTALCAHFFTEAALVTLLPEQVFDNDMIETKRFKEQVTEAYQNSDIANKEVSSIVLKETKTRSVIF